MGPSTVTLPDLTHMFILFEKSQRCVILTKLYQYISDMIAMTVQFEIFPHDSFLIISQNVCMAAKGNSVLCPKMLRLYVWCMVRRYTSHSFIFTAP